MSSVDPLPTLTVPAGDGRVNAKALDGVIQSIVGQVNTLIAAIGVIRQEQGRFQDKVVSPRQLSDECTELLQEITTLIASLRQQFINNYDPRQAITTTPTSSDTSDNIPFVMGQAAPTPDFAPAMTLTGRDGTPYALTLRLRSIARKTLVSPTTPFAFNVDSRIVAAPTIPENFTEAVGVAYPDGVICVNGVVDPFIFTVKTNNAGGYSTNNQFALPLSDTGTYSFQVDWGDGQINTVTAWNDANAIHTYSVAGTHQIKISGLCDGWSFGDFYDNHANASDAPKMVTIDHWGSLHISAQEEAFRRCSNMQVPADDFPDLTTVTTLGEMFEDCTALTGIANIGLWKMRGITVARRMFNNCPNFNDAGLINWDVSGIQNFFRMFRQSGFNQDISAWDVRNATGFGSMFNGNSVFNQDLSAWQTDSILDMEQMFFNATAFKKADKLAGWNVSKVTSMSNMFTGCDINSPNSAANQTNYNALLLGWSAQNVRTGVPFHAGLASKYTIATAGAARTILTGKGWTISDGGGV